MKRFFVCAILGAGLLALSSAAFAADAPIVRQPNDPALTSSDRAALAAAWSAVGQLLTPDYQLASLVHLSGRTWAEADFVQFAAGVLQGAGYAVDLATGPWAGGTTRTWILVGIPSSQGLAYFPVEAAPSLLPAYGAIGQIAWQGGVAGSSYDVRYLTFSQATPLAANLPPAVTLSVAPHYVVANETTTLIVSGQDPDGEILFNLWTFADGTTVADPRPVLWHTFRKVGTTTVFVSVFDTRGGHTDLSEELDVLAEKPDCGCN